MMGPGSGMGHGPGMMGGPFTSTARPITMDEAVRMAERHLQNHGNPDLTFNEVHGFAYNYYIPVYESSTGKYAFELLVDRFGGTVMPEPGPNMMRNTKYAMMGGMMGPGGIGGRVGPQGQPGVQVAPTVDTPVTREQAVRTAQDFMNRFLAGTTTGEVHDFYGYRTVEVMRDGRMQGMLSVNGYTGAVWYHTWHGDFVEDWQRAAAPGR